MVSIGVGVVCTCGNHHESLDATLSDPKGLLARRCAGNRHVGMRLMDFGKRHKSEERRRWCSRVGVGRAGGNARLKRRSLSGCAAPEIRRWQRDVLTSVKHGASDAAPKRK